MSFDRFAIDPGLRDRETPTVVSLGPVVSFVVLRCVLCEEPWPVGPDTDGCRPSVGEGSTEAAALHTDELRAAARLYATGGNAAIYYGLGVTEHSQGSTAVMGIANLAMLIIK